MLWFVLALPGVAHAQDCVASEDGEHESLRDALDDGAREIVVTCNHLEVGLDLNGNDDPEDDVSISVDPGVTLRLCGRERLLIGDPALSVNHSDLVIDAGAGDVVIESPYASVFVGIQGSVELIDVQVTGAIEGCPAADDPLLNYERASLLDVRGELALLGGEVRHGVAAEGGGAWVRGSLTAAGTRFFHNIALVGGGAIYLDGGELFLDDVDFIDNEAGPFGGGAIDLWGMADAVEIVGGLFEGNQSSGNGGAVAHPGSYLLEIRDSTFRNNDTYGTQWPSTTYSTYLGGGRRYTTYTTYTTYYGGYVAGGAVDSWGQATVEGVVFDDNRSNYGAALVVGGDSEVVDSTFRGNEGAGALKVLWGQVALQGLVFDDNGGASGAYVGVDAADLLVDGGATVDATALAMCSRGGTGTRVHLFNGAKVDVRGLLVHTSQKFSGGSGEMDLWNATITAPGEGTLFDAPGTVRQSIVQAPGRTAGEADFVRSLVQLSGYVPDAGVLTGRAYYLGGGAPPADPCAPSGYRPYPGTAGTFEPGPQPKEDNVDVGDPDDDWGAWGQPEGWAYLFEQTGEGVDHPLADDDGDGPWVYDCDGTDGSVSALASEVCDEHGGDEDCDGRVGPDGVATVLWPVDRDRDGQSGTWLSCMEPPWSVPNGGPGDCHDFDPDSDPAPMEWIDADGDGIPALRANCHGSAAMTSWDGPPDCDDDDETVWRMGPVLVDGDGDGVPADPLDAKVDCIGDQALAPMDGSYDCDDEDETRAPGLLDVPDDGIDQNCDGTFATSYAVGGCAFAPSPVQQRWTWGLARRR